MHEVGYVIPTLGNNMDYLKRAVTSIRNQELPSELVLVTTADSVEVIDYALSENLNYVVAGKDGVARAFNVGIQYLDELGCIFFSTLGEDDELLASSSMSLHAAISKNTNYLAAIGRLWYIDANGIVVFHNRATTWLVKLIHIIPNVIPHPGALSRISVWKEIGGFDESLSSCSDLDYWLKIRKHGRLIRVECPMALFRWHSGSHTANLRESSIREAALVRRKYRNRLENLFFAPLDLILRIIGEHFLQRNL